jgi:hypothetical protein
VFTSTGFAEESIKGVVTSADSLVTGHLTIWLNAVLQAKKLPAGISNLNTALSKVKAKNFTHDCKVEVEGFSEVCKGFAGSLPRDVTD